MEKSHLIILLGAIVLTSGCVSNVSENIQQGTVDQIFFGESLSCDYEIEYDSEQKILADSTSLLVEKDEEEIDFQVNIENFSSSPENISIQEMEFDLKYHYESWLQDEERIEMREEDGDMRETMCRESPNQDGEFNCSIEPQESVIQLDIGPTENNLCDNWSMSPPPSIKLVHVEEDLEFENEDFQFEIHEIREEIDEDGWKNFEMETELENKEITSEQASQGINPRYNLYDNDGERLERAGQNGPSRVLEGYSEEGSITRNTRQDIEIGYLKMGDQQDYLPTIIFPLEERY